MNLEFFLGVHCSAQGGDGWAAIGRPVGGPPTVSGRRRAPPRHRADRGGSGDGACGHPLVATVPDRWRQLVRLSSATGQIDLLFDPHEHVC